MFTLTPKVPRFYSIMFALIALFLLASDAFLFTNQRGVNAQLVKAETLSKPAKNHSKKTVFGLTSQTVPGVTGPDINCVPGWHITASANRGSNSTNLLLGVDALVANDVWAVGYSGAVPDNQSLIEHWNGSAWRIVPSPNPVTGTYSLDSVSIVSAVDIWAVGYFKFSPNLADSAPLFQHWDGTRWSVVQSSEPPVRGGYLYGVHALSTDDIWAVGESYNNIRYSSLIEHWNGSAWRIVPSPNVGIYDDHLNDVAAISTNDVWAVGEYSSPGVGFQPLILHWNGSEWSPMDTSSSHPFSIISGITALSPTDIWAVGLYQNTNSQYSHALTLHWNGIMWTEVPEAVSTELSSQLTSVAAISPNDAWAVGVVSAASNQYPDKPLIEHWNGTAWAVMPNPNVGPIYGALANLVALTFNDVWAVGHSGVLSNYANWQTLAERYGGIFSDVHPTDYFYEAVRYLKCLGVISGYADDTFRPFNNSTRGQLCKIVVLAEDFPIYTPTTPTFRDVLTNNTFYQYVETAYQEGIISGYNCGASCLEFRPGNSITRAQLCKIVVLAEQWALYTPPAPTFRDVPSTDPFYHHIETAYQHNIISGYSCGMGCVEFRPNSDATRGQICKIVYNAIILP